MTGDTMIGASFLHTAVNLYFDPALIAMSLRCVMPATTSCRRMRRVGSLSPTRIATSRRCSPSPSTRGRTGMHSMTVWVIAVLRRKRLDW